MDKVTIGSPVHFVLPDGQNAGQHRPAVVVRVVSEEMVQLQLFTDGSNVGERLLLLLSQ